MFDCIPKPQLFSIHLDTHKVMKTTHDHLIWLVEAPSPKDRRQRRQLHCPNGREVKGGHKHVMCQPRWHWSHKSIVAVLFFSPHTKQIKSSGMTVGSGWTVSSMGRWYGIQFLECSWHSLPSLSSNNNKPRGNIFFTWRIVCIALISDVIGASRWRYILSPCQNLRNWGR